MLNRGIVGTGIALSLSTEWAQGRLDRPEWDARALGLGGWSVDVLQRYDPVDGVLLGGDGSWRIVAATELDNGERAVPSFDSRRVFVFDSEWRHVRTLDDITGATLLTFSYDAEGLLAGADGSVDSDPIHLRITRDATGRSIRLVGMAGAETLASVDDNGDLVGIVPALGTATLITPGRWGLIKAWQNVGGQPTTYAYDPAGRMASSIDPDGVTTKFERIEVPRGFEVRATTSLGRLTTVRHEAVAGVVVRSLTDSSGLTTRLEIATDGARTVDYPDGTVVTVGNQPHPRWGSAVGIPTPFVERRPDGTEHREETGPIVATGSGDDPYGRSWRKEVLVDGQRWVQSYDPAARTLNWADPAGRQTSDTFDEVGRIIGRVRPGLPSESYAYDADGRLQSITRGTAGSAAITTFAHDPSTGAVSVTLPDGRVGTQAYDGNGLMARNVAADGSAVSAMRDAEGRVIQIRYGDHPSTTLGYSPGGRPTAYLPPIVADDTSYELRTYDEDGNVAAVAGPGDRSLTVTYDTGGRPASWQLDRGVVTAAYDAVTGQLARLSAPHDIGTTMRYAGLPLVGITWTGPVPGDVGISLDAGSRLSAETVNGADVVHYARDPAGYLLGLGDLGFVVGQGRLPASSSMGVVDTAWTYDADGRPTRSVASVNGNTVYGLAYEYDSLGRISAIERSEPSASVRRTRYLYDEVDRLAAVTIDGVAAQTYAYDAAGNRISITEPTATLTGIYDDRDRLVEWAGATYEYSARGTVSARRDATGSTLYDYDDVGSLHGLTVPDGRLIEYYVDGSGWRLGRLVNGDLVAGYLYRPDGLLAAQTDANGTVVARFAYDDTGRLAWVRRDGHSYRIITDHLGSPVLAIDAATGVVAQQIEYDAWGVILSDSNPGFTPFGFAGGLLDPDSGLVHFGARDYDPATGRWTGPDPIRFAGGDPNLYRYVRSDPVNGADPTGLGNCAGNVHFYGCDPDAEEKLAPPEYEWKELPPPPAPPCQGVLCDLPPPPPPWEGVPGSQSAPPEYTAPGEIVPFGPQPPPPEYTAPGEIVPFGPQPPTAPAPSTTPPPGGGGSGFCLGICSLPGGGICIGFCSFGDPHLRTGDGRAVDFMSAGEFTVTRSPDGTTVVQTRQEPPTFSTTVTLTTAVAMFVGTDRVGIYAGTERRLVLNGEVQTRTDVSARLPGGGVVEAHGSEVTVDWPDGSRLTAHVYGYFMNYNFTPSATLGPVLVGVLGNRDGNPANDSTTSAGVVLDPGDPAFFDRLHHEFADSWRISQAESLFDYAPGETTATFTHPEIPTAKVSVADLDPSKRTAAEALCRAVGVTSEPTLSDCILDVGVTGDPSFAGSAASVAAATAASATATQTPTTETTLGSPTSGEIRQAQQVSRYRLTASAGQVVYLDAQGACVDGLLWRLLRPDGAAVGVAAACNDLGRQVLPTAGDWLIEFYSESTAVGSFAFTALGAPAATESIIAVGDSVSGRIEAIGTWHRYRFTASAGQVVYLDAQGACVDGMLWRLLQPDGTDVAVAAACNDLGHRVLAAAGDWVIEVFSDTTAMGDFAFATISVPAATESAITVGNAVTGQIEAIGAWHRYRFTAAAGQVVNLDAQGACVDGMLWRLLQPDGTGVAVAAACNDLGRQLLPIAGDWVIEVYSDTTAVGSFTFIVNPG